MKKLVYIALLLLVLAPACTGKEKTTWEQFAPWREANNQWLLEMQQRKNPDGTDYYKTIVADWDPQTFVLIHYFNDRAETEGNLSPLFTSTIETSYHLHLYNGVGVDSAASYRTSLANTIPGWGIGVSDMRCGDTAEIVVPYPAGYGSQNLSAIPPYSNLQFNVRLVDIIYYDAPPYK